MKVEWTALALADVEGLIDHLQEFGQAAVRKVVKPILDGAALLEELPNLGVESRDLASLGRYRHLVIGRYRVIYRVDEVREVVFVLRVWDTRRDPHGIDLGE